MSLTLRGVPPSFKINSDNATFATSYAKCVVIFDSSFSYRLIQQILIGSAVMLVDNIQTEVNLDFFIQRSPSKSRFDATDLSYLRKTAFHEIILDLYKSR
jgi:hypothetical protein